MGKKKEKNEKSYAQKLLPWIIVAVMVYTIAAFLLQFYAQQSIDSTVTQMYFAFWTIEIINLATIKKAKVKKENKKSIIEDAVETIVSKVSDNDEEK